MEKKYTPGPWATLRSADDVTMWVDAENGDVLATIHRANIDTRDANARLIAAAPELVEIIDELLATYYGAPDPDVFKRAEAVLAKALGD